MLFMLSICFVITMDLFFLNISLQESFDNLFVPFRSMMNEEVIIISLILLYTATKPIVIHYMKKK